MSTRYDVFGIGSALVDIQAQVGDDIIDATGQTKGGMALTDIPSRTALLEQLGNINRNIASGGSVANTLAGIAKLGGSTAMAGCVANDSFGEQYKEDIEKAGVHFISQPGEGDTGTCVVLITPDAQRTMYTTLGCAPQIGPAQVNNETIITSKILYVEGYLWDTPDTIAVVRKAMETARANGVKVAFSASDSFCVSRHGDDFKDILANLADIFFANADEAKAITGCDSFDGAVSAMAEKCPCVVVTNGGEGSTIVAEGTRYDIASVPCTPVDTTGAGDSYAAGILYGIATGQSYEEMGNNAARIASIVVSRLGARY